MEIRNDPTNQPRHLNRNEFIDALAAMELHDVFVTTYVRTTPAFHSATLRSRQSGKLAGLTFKTFVYKRKVYVVRVA